MINKLVTNYLKLKFFLGKFIMKNSTKYNKYGSLLINNILNTQFLQNKQLDLGLSILKIERNNKSKSINILVSNQLLLEGETYYLLYFV